MKSARFLFCLTALVTAGCATSLAPSENFDDWSNAAVYHHYQQPRYSVATAPAAPSVATAPRESTQR